MLIVEMKRFSLILRDFHRTKNLLEVGCFNMEEIGKSHEFALTSGCGLSCDVTCMQRIANATTIDINRYNYEALQLIRPIAKSRR